MLSINTKLKQIRDILNDCSDNVYHYKRPTDKSKPFIVWQEDSESSGYDLNNTKSEQEIHGTIDYFTKTEYDDVIESIQNGLADNKVGFALSSVQYEDDTEFIHYEWEFYI